MKLEIRYYPIPAPGEPAAYSVVATANTLREACALYPYLEPERHRQVLEGLNAWRAYTWPVFRRDGRCEGLYAAVPPPPPAPRPRRRGAVPFEWQKRARPGEMRVVAAGDLVECHICGALVVSVGHHARWQHRMSPAEYRERFGLNRGTPLCAPAYSLQATRRNLRLRLGRHIAPYRFRDRPAQPRRSRRLEARRNISEGRRALTGWSRPRRRRLPPPPATAARVDPAFDWGSVLRT